MQRLVSLCVPHKTNKTPKQKDIKMNETPKQRGVQRYCCSKWDEKVKKLYHENREEFEKVYWDTQYCSFCGKKISEKDGKAVKVWVKFDRIWPWEDEKERRNSTYYWGDGQWAIPLEKFMKIIEEMDLV